MQMSGPRARASVDSRPRGTQNLLRPRVAVVKMIVNEIQKLNDGLNNEKAPIQMAKAPRKLTALMPGAG